MQATTTAVLLEATTTTAYAVLLIALLVMCLFHPTMAHAQALPVLVSYAPAKEFCTTWPGTRLDSYTDPSTSNDVFYCVADCQPDEMCAELHMPIFANGSTPDSAGATGALCRNFPDQREGMCLKKNILATPVLTTLSGVTEADPATQRDIGVYCFDAPNGTTEVSTKCGAGKISRSLCRGFFSTIFTYTINAGYRGYGHMSQCGTDPLVSLTAFSGHCMCDERVVSGITYQNALRSMDLMGRYPTSDLSVGSLIPDTVCLLTPQSVDTDNGCPAGHTWQANPAPMGYVCVVSDDGTTSLPWCPQSTVLTPVCSGDLSKSMILDISYGTFYPYGLGYLKKCVTAPLFSANLLPPAPLTCLWGDATTTIDSPSPTGTSPFCQRAIYSTSADSKLFIGSNCPTSEVCMPLPTGSNFRDYRCGSGYRCQPNPCATEYICAPADYDAASNTCASCTTACPATQSCQRSVYGNDTHYGCPNGRICLPTVNSCPDYTICQPVSGFAPAADSRCPSGMVCGPSCPLRTHNCSASGTGNSHGCPVGTSCLSMASCPVTSFVDTTATCQLACGSGICSPVLVSDIVTASNFHQTCPAGMACSTCERGFLCADSNAGLTGNAKCMLAHHSENECSPVCPANEECLESLTGLSSSLGCPVGFTCQPSVCGSGMQCRHVDRYFLYEYGPSAPEVYFYPPCGTERVCSSAPEYTGGAHNGEVTYHPFITCDGPIDPDVMSLKCPSYYGSQSSSLSCDSGVPTNPDGLTCFSCPVGEQCMYDGDNHRTQFGCQGLGFRCQSAVNLTSQTYPCGVGFACRDDGIPWTSNASCPDSQICDFACPPSMECEEDWQNGNTDLGCPAGWICKVPFDPIPGGGGCPAGHVCVSNEVTGKGYSDPGCAYRRHTCEWCRAGQKCDPDYLPDCICVDVCGHGQVCRDDGVVSTHSIGCPSEQVCVRACPAGYNCEVDSIHGLSLPGCNGPSSCTRRTNTPTFASPTQSISLNPPVVTTPPPTTLPPPIQTYFGYGPNKVRYPDHTPTPITGIVSGIPLLYSDLFKTSTYAARFLVTDPFNSLIRLGVTATSGDAVTTRLALHKTTSSTLFDGVSIGQSTTASICTSFVDPESQSETTTMSSSSVECGLPLTCTSTSTVTAAGNPFTDSIIVRANPVALTPTCPSSSTPTTKLSGIVYSSVPFSQGLFQSYALLSDNNAAHTNLTSSDVATVFKATSNQWTSSSIDATATVTGINGTRTIYLIGNEANPTSSSSAPIVERQFAPVLINNTTSGPQLREGSGSTVFCALPDQTSYMSSFVTPGAMVVGGGIASSCFTFTTVDEIHAACDASSDCVGFTTVRVYARELPLCLHVVGSDPQASVYSYDRVFYKRPSQEKSCSVGVQKSGKVAVYVQQTTFGVAQAVVRVNGAVKTVCGGSSSFANGFTGKSGRCQLYALCYADNVPSDAVVTVSVQGTASQSGCENTLGALITQTSVDATQVAATTQAPIERLSLPGAISRPVLLPAGSTLADIRRLPFYVYKAHSAALDVAQTGFDCSLSSCPSSLIRMSSQGSCQSCGGASGFYNNNRAGESDQCSMGLFCGGAMSLVGGAAVVDVSRCEAAASAPQPSPFSGHVTITVDPSSLRARTSLCTSFNATLYLTSSSSLSDSSSGDIVVPPFPLLSDSGDGPRTLLTAPSTLSESAAIAYAAERSNFTSSAPATKLAPLFITGPYGNRVHAIYSRTLGGGTPQTSLHVNSTLLCVVDHNAGLSTKCIFPIPRGSLKVKILVAQNDFAADNNELAVSFLAGSTIRSTTQCGGLRKFGREAGAQEQCSDYRACADVYMYGSDAEALSISDGIISIDIPATIRPRGCNFTASILVVFEKPLEAVSPFECSTFECPGERRCLPYSSVCDQIQDCASNVDEEWCTPWRPLDTGYAFCVPSYLTTNYTDHTYSDCRRLAAINTTSAFALIGSTCVVYSSTISPTLLANPNDYLCAVSGAVVHVRLTGSSASSFAACTSSIQCNGHGVASSSSSTTTSGLSCTCTCTAGYTGADCSERLSLSSIRTLVVVFAIAPNASLSINRESVAGALTLNTTTMDVACDTVVPSPRSTEEVYVECTITSISSVPADSYVHRRKLLSPQIWNTLNADFKYGGDIIPQINYITARTTMQPVLPMAECIGQSCINRKPFTKLRVTALSATALTTATVTLVDTTDTTASSSRVLSSRKDMSCTTAFTDVGGGCVSSTCDLDMEGSGTANVSVSATSYAAADVTTGECSTAGVSMFVHDTYGDIPTTTSDAVVNTEEDYSWFLIGAIFIFVGGWLVFTVLCIVFACIHSRRLGAFNKLADTSHMSAVAKLKTHLLARLAFVQNAKDQGNIRADRCATVSVSAATMCAIGAIFLTLYYVTAYDRDSNFSVMYEEYTDSLCSASPTASMPRRIFSIPQASTECTKMSVTGETVGVVYADGHCVGVDGVYNAILQTGGTFLQCMGAQSMSVRSGTCLKVSELDPDDARDVYVQLSCSTASQITDRTTTISTLTTIPDTFTMMTVATLSTDLQFGSRVDGPPSYSSNSRTVYQFPYLAGGNIKTSTSSNPMTVASTASSMEFDGIFDASRVVYQQYPDTFQADPDHTVYADIETNLLPHMASLQDNDVGVDLALSTPHNGDYPVGYLFGGFGTSSELTWRGAGPLAHRHYDILGTNFDVSSHLPSTIEEMVDGEGFTISMYLRVTNITQGFAFAVTDAFENAIGGTVYTLDRLAEMIDNGQPSSSWFNTTYSVYASLYVSGPGRQLTFAHADPDTSDRVELLEWDLERIGADYLFNGLWHHVAVVYRVENGKLRAQLIVDGSTSYAKEGWSLCANRIPSKVHRINNTAPVYDMSTDKVTDRGLLVVGYMNGGVYGLTAAPTETLSTDLLSTGTYPMRQHNAFPRVKTLVLGSVLVVLGGIALVYLIIGGTIDIRRMMSASSVSASREAMHEFLTLQKTCIRSSRLFGKSTRRRSSSTITHRLKPIRLATALRWTGLDLHQFASIPSELAVQTKLPGEQLLLILYNIRKKTSASEFSVEEWNGLVDQDQVEYSSSRRCFCLHHKSDATKDATLLGGTTDLFATMMASITSSTSAAVLAGSEVIGEFSDDEAAGDDVEHRGGGDGAGEVAGLDVGSGGGGDSLIQSSSVLKSLADVFAPMIVVFQSMYVWSSSIDFPSLYDDYFGEIFSFVSIDVAMTFPGIPSIATPLAQMALGFMIVSVVIYFIFEDHRRFENSLTKYLWRRDVFECADTNKDDTDKSSAAFATLHTSLPTALTDVLLDRSIPEPMIRLPTLPIRDCRTLDLITGRIPKVHDDDITNYDAMDEFIVSNEEGVEFTIHRDLKNRKHLTIQERGNVAIGGDSQEPTTSPFKPADGKRSSSVVSSQSTTPSSSSNELLRIGCNCWRHPDVPLAPVQQSDIYPFSNPSSCCCMINGELCGTQVGQMFVCNEKYLNENGDEIVCTFGLCALHCRQSLKETIISQIYGAKRMVTHNGFGWLATIGIVFAVNTIYTPFLKTALMILACHPYYQCEFEHCWAFMTQKFALAAFLSGSVVLVLGIGFPVLLLVQLYRRRSVLNLAFFGNEYNDRYVSPDTRGPNFNADNWFIRRKHLLTSEWSRFGASDNSALAQQYGDASYRWLMMPAIALVFKVVVLIPAVFLEPRSWEQRLGSATVEITIAAFYFLTSTQLSPILLTTLRAASVHQLLVLGLQNVDLVTQFDSSITVSMGLVGVTLVYITFSIIVFFATVALPIVATRTDKSTIRKFLNEHGFDYSSGISLYLVPGGADTVTTTSSPLGKMVGSSSNSRRASAFEMHELMPRQASVAFDDIHSMSSCNSSGGGSKGGCVPHSSNAFFDTRRRRSSAAGLGLRNSSGMTGANYTPSRRKSRNELSLSHDSSSHHDGHLINESSTRPLPHPNDSGAAISCNSLEYSTEVGSNMGGRLDSLQTVTFTDPPPLESDGDGPVVIRRRRRSTLASSSTSPAQLLQLQTVGNADDQ